MPVGEGLAPPLLASLLAKKKRMVIPSEARNLFFLEEVANYNKGLGGSAGTEKGLVGPAGFGALAGLVADAALPTVRYLRIFSSRFGPMPLMARKSSTLLNGPYDLRICKIFSAVTGPIPGTSCSSSELAVLRLIGAGGGFFLAARLPAVTQSSPSNRKIEAINRGIIGG